MASASVVQAGQFGRVMHCQAARHARMCLSRRQDHGPDIESKGQRDAAGNVLGAVDAIVGQEYGSGGHADLVAQR